MDLYITFMISPFALCLLSHNYRGLILQKEDIMVKYTFRHLCHDGCHGKPPMLLVKARPHHSRPTCLPLKIMFPSDQPLYNCYPRSIVLSLKWQSGPLKHRFDPPLLDLLEGSAGWLVSHAYVGDRVVAWRP